MYSNGLSWLLMTAFKNLRCKFFVDFKLYKWNSADKVSTLKNHKFVIINYCFQVIKSGSVKLSWKYHNTYFLHLWQWVVYFRWCWSHIVCQFLPLLFFPVEMPLFLPKIFLHVFFMSNQVAKAQGLKLGEKLSKHLSNPKV